ncbi:DUF4309 domain-containing protein [Paenibacillus sp. WQ 127069]|uniref:DUF4309 domain-containing protein n=1 Tax=Paenibacillus baimaensis TaxID=2982185 RepID=A0ABT2UJN6_9BACL|nr:DUF4309 domain-containing protein [Paenibacillus sp. WQ 127069]MCU6794827.1 DUF4309 domain-containing protein [Paenibacillus sp. WQ 127069]
MTTKSKLHTLSPATIVLILLLSGCTYPTSESAHQHQPGTQDMTPQPLTLAEPTPTSPSSPAAIDEPAPATPPAASNASDKVSLASVEPAVKSEPSVSEVKPAPAKPKIDIRDPYNQAKPTLLGLTLNSSKEGVTTRYGKPSEQFVMDEDTDPITVLDYKDFLVGFNKKNQLTFIDIRSAEINPGLNGLKLGQSTSQVYEALGKPDTNTSFVLTYKSTGAVLKLDIDPKTDKVNSIKLFTLQE